MVTRLTEVLACGAVLGWVTADDWRVSVELETISA
jgi:hypothetical protein